MAFIDTQNHKLALEPEIADGMFKTALDNSVITRLSGREAQKFGEVQIMELRERPKAEFVGESQDHGSTTLSYGSVKVVPHKVHVTVRITDETKWQDEDGRIEIMKDIASEGALALGRALDLGMIHGINPLTGGASSVIKNKITDATKRVNLNSGEADQVVRSAAGLLIDQVSPIVPNAVAFDPTTTFALANLQTKNADGSASGVQRYPNLGLGTNISSFLGLNAAQSSTVSGRPEAKDSTLRAIVGNFAEGIRWGVQKDIPLEVIRYGDPDGQGDLRRKGHIALRLEAVYGWYVRQDHFALVVNG